jgi:hypothetical protein
MKWQTSCRLVTVLFMSFTIDFTSINFVQDGFRNSSRNSAGLTVRTSVTAFWAGIVRTLCFSRMHGHRRRIANGRIIKWKHTTCPLKKKFKSQLTAGKVMLTIFWNSQGPIFGHYQEQSAMINRSCYSKKLKPAIRSKHHGQLSQDVLLHDNSHPRTAANTSNTPAAAPRS